MASACACTNREAPTPPLLVPKPLDPGTAATTLYPLPLGGWVCGFADATAVGAVSSLSSSSVSSSTTKQYDDVVVAYVYIEYVAICADV